MSQLAVASSVAVVGATGDTNSLFGRPLRYLQSMGFQGRVYPVNPKYDTIGELACYPTVESLPETVDVALVLVGARRVVEIMDSIGRSGTKLAVVCASGFSEIGAEGSDLQNDLSATANRHGITFVGPNSQGVYIRATGLALTFNPAIDRAKDFPSSGIVYSGQSGAVGAQVAGLLKRSRLSLAALMSTGNEAQVSAVDLALESLALDGTRSVVVYAESIPQPERFTELLAASEDAAKPVVLLLGGFSQLARKSAQSHTGSLTPPGSQVRALADYYGVPICQEPAEAVAAAQVLQQRGSQQPTRHRTHAARRAQVGMLTTSGGSAVLAADICADLGVDLPPLTSETVAKLATLIPSFGAATNPVDVTAEMQKSGADAWLEANRAVADDPNVDILWVAIGYTVGAVGVARSEAIVRLLDLVDKPILVSWLAPPEDTTEGRGILAAAGIPVLDTLTGAIRAARVLAHSHARRVGPRTNVTPVRDFDLFDSSSDSEIRTRLPLRFAERISAVDQDAVDAWLGQRKDQKFVIKGEVAGVSHKSDWGGVATGVANEAVPAVAQNMTGIALEKFGAAPQISIEEDIAHTGELLVGYQRGDVGLPPTLMLGWGGYYAEAIGDTTILRCIADVELIGEHLMQLRLARVLRGFRNSPTIDVANLAEQLAQLAGAFTQLPPDVLELEINPVALGADGKSIVGLDILVVRGNAVAR